MGTDPFHGRGGLPVPSLPPLFLSPLMSFSPLLLFVSLRLDFKDIDNLRCGGRRNERDSIKKMETGEEWQGSWPENCETISSEMEHALAFFSNTRRLGRSRWAKWDC
jgi:hypothetical protein